MLCLQYYLLVFAVLFIWFCLVLYTVWYINLQIDTEGGSSRFRVLPDGSLQIVNTERSDAGQYTCEASNGVGNPDKKNIQLIVSGKSKGSSGIKIIEWIIEIHLKIINFIRIC